MNPDVCVTVRDVITLMDDGIYLQGTQDQVTVADADIKRASSETSMEMK